MPRVRLVVTGDLEKAALGPSLERVLRAAGADVTFDRPLLVTDWLRRAVQERVVERFSFQGAESPDADRAREELRMRCSFHLLAPLSEAYFFGEAAALARTGVGQGIPVHRLGTDVEAFETDDPEFLPTALKKNAEMAENGYTWWREERHPKRYLEFLVGRSGGLYQETEGGVQALGALDWPSVGAEPRAVHFARALFEDLSDALAIPNPLGVSAVSGWIYPARNVRRETLTLRNL